MGSDHHQALHAAGACPGWFPGRPPQLGGHFSPYQGKGDKTELTPENQCAQGRFILITNTWEVVWRNKVIVRLGGKAGFFPPINKMIAVKKTKPQQLLSVKATGFLQLHPCAKPALPIKYKNKFLCSGTRARPNPTSSHSKEKEKKQQNTQTKYIFLIKSINHFSSCKHSAHNIIPALHPHPIPGGSREKGHQDSSNTCVKR